MRNPYGFEMSNSCLTCHFRQAEFFCQLSPAELKEFDSIKFVTAYPSDAVLFLERQKPRGVYIVCEGQVKLFFDSSEGRTLGLRIADAGEMLGLYSLMSGNPYEVTAVTLRPCQIALVPTADFQDFLKRHPAHYEWVAGEMSAEYKSACDQIRNIGLRASLAERVAGFLLDWSRRAGAVADGAGFGLHLKHDDIAEQIGLSRESVTRALTLLARLGLIKKSGSLLSIPSRMALQEFRSPQVGSPQITPARPAGDDGLTQITRSPIQHDRLSWNPATGGQGRRRASVR